MKADPMISSFDVPPTETTAAPCFKRLVSIEKARTPTAISRALQSAVVANGCAAGALAVLTSDQFHDPGLEILWAEQTTTDQTTDQAVEVTRALLPMLEATDLATGEVHGRWSPSFTALGEETIARVAARWGASHIAAIGVARVGPFSSWLLLGGRADDSEARFEARITEERAERIRLLSTALGQAVGRLLEQRLSKTLSETQRDILAKLADGMRPAQIAVSRGASEATVRNQISRLRSRMGAKSDAEAVAIALRRELI